MEKEKNIPGKKSRILSEELSSYECHNITAISSNGPIFWQQAKGVHVWDVDGNKYLDLSGGFGVAALGYRHPKIYRSLLNQLDTLWHVMGDVYPSKEKVELCRLLSQITFEKWENQRGKVILGCTGSDAIEAALKTAFFHTKKNKFITFYGGYHGLSLGALAVNGLDDFRKPLEGLYAPIASFLPYPSCIDCIDKSQSLTQKDCLCEPLFEEKLEKMIHEGYGAILFEPLQGRGGIVVPPDWFLPLLRRMSTKHNILLIADEIFTGLYRTGKRFGCDVAGIVPDIICLGKSMAGAFPISACIGRENVMDSWPKNDGEAIHTSTFLGNPIGCRMAIEQIKELEKKHEQLFIEEKGEYFLSLLNNLSKRFNCLKNPRGKGLFLGVDIVDEKGCPAPEIAAKIVIKMLQKGIIVLTEGPFRNVLSFTPPLIISFKQIGSVVRILEQIIKIVLKETKWS
ncbi:aspartate aminotransferase family protein [Candidatus Methylacidiphilum fumarolicum]|uniref:4-aminobutyrate aminotransferase or related aminotransferase n=2 Tax=Candidatus Methylacidiphilum fumarolicum TaxID=591154 RepID=I0JWN3_METFB|nr:aspartate aminotransferase family protein [Candidatus Methylacidiphilum fumarolicum]MBW6414339.1 aspartate aminotransferase family protein [Candidatus Methylacidiphilum fumarolicum]TFE66238.1 4-aminobutyrate aminotransferase [Candidatus Methylacidiphilum fumarolicum]TFE73022.1 aspartate aminotransferase family protein [Candidatus Methylacidiphilum fumarolicum]TFE75116.1 aspartate aminotransferase family protein [Candidatus Methylacidiphilum fumarolicum]TFE76337.1 4-aminobutyrate aminotransf